MQFLYRGETVILGEMSVNVATNADEGVYSRSKSAPHKMLKRHRGFAVYVSLELYLNVK